MCQTANARSSSQPPTSHTPPPRCLGTAPTAHYRSGCVPPARRPSWPGSTRWPLAASSDRSCRAAGRDKSPSAIAVETTAAPRPQANRVPPHTAHRRCAGARCTTPLAQGAECSAARTPQSACPLVPDLAPPTDVPQSSPILLPGVRPDGWSNRPHSTAAETWRARARGCEMDSLPARSRRPPAPTPPKPVCDSTAATTRRPPRPPTSYAGIPQSVRPPAIQPRPIARDPAVQTKSARPAPTTPSS
jgi:hypothetical protein